MTATALEKTETAAKLLDPGSIERDLFLDLPEDVRRLLLCSYIGPQGTANLSACSSALRALCKHDDLWKDFCCRELGLKPSQLQSPPSYRVSYTRGHIGNGRTTTLIGGNRLEPGPVLSYWQLYSQLLYPFRGLLQKLLASDTSPHGDILTLTYVEGRIIGEVWWLPKETTDSMKPLVEFVVCLDRDGKPIVLHEFAKDKSSEMTLPANSLSKHIRRKGRGDGDQSSNWIFGFRCRNGEYRSNGRDLGALMRLMYRIREDGLSCGSQKLESFLSGVEVVGNNWPPTVITKRSSKYKHRVETIPAPVVFSTGLALPLGFFKGTYGLHGHLLFKMEYVQATRNLRGTMMTGGGPDAPAGRIAFEFPVDRAVVLSLEQQLDAELLKTMHQTGPFHAVDRLPDMQQPFRLPTALNVWYAAHSNLLGDTCQLRLMGYATTVPLEFHGDSNSADMVVFSPEKFTVFWLGRSECLSVFVKVASDDAFCAYY